MTDLRTEPWVVEQVTVVHRASGVHGAQRRLTFEEAYRDAARSFIREQRVCTCSDVVEDIWAADPCWACAPDLRLVERVARLMRRADHDEVVKVARDAAAMGLEDDARRLMAVRHAHQHGAAGGEGESASGNGRGRDNAGRGPGRRE